VDEKRFKKVISLDRGIETRSKSELFEFGGWKDGKWDRKTMNERSREEIFARWSNGEHLKFPSSWPENKTLTQGQPRAIVERENRKEIEQQKMMSYSKSKENHVERFKARDNQRRRLAVTSEFERNRCSRLCRYIRPLPAGGSSGIICLHANPTFLFNLICVVSFIRPLARPHEIPIRPLKK
jgi:hypothetical protein